MRKHYGIARDALEVAIALESDQIYAYFALAQVLAMFGKKAEAIDYANSALTKIIELRLKKLPLPKHMQEGTDQLQILVTEFLRELEFQGPK